MAYRLAEHETEPRPPLRARRRSRRRQRGRGQRAERRRQVARKSVAVLPTLFTLGNLLCGFASIFIASRAVPGDPVELPFGWSPLTFAAIFIFVGMAADALDGRIARLTRSTSDLGEQLDSMADMVTFGVAPAFLAVQLVGVGVPFVSELAAADRLFDRVVVVIAGIYVACAALRLARFNLELDSTAPHQAGSPANASAGTGSGASMAAGKVIAKVADHTLASPTAAHNSFKGLPSPGAAGTVASLVLLHEHFLAHDPVSAPLLQAARGVMVAVMLLAALAMVSQFRYVHVMNRYVRNRASFVNLARAVVVGLLLVVQPQESLAAVFVLYALSAPLIATYQRLRRGGTRKGQDPGDDGDGAGGFEDVRAEVG